MSNRTLGKSPGKKGLSNEQKRRAEHDIRGLLGMGYSVRWISDEISRQYGCYKQAATKYVKETLQELLDNQADLKKSARLNLACAIEAHSLLAQRAWEISNDSGVAPSVQISAIKEARENLKERSQLQRLTPMTKDGTVINFLVQNDNSARDMGSATLVSDARAGRAALEGRGAKRLIDKGTAIAPDVFVVENETENSTTD